MCATVSPAEFRDEQYRLYLRYQQGRHPDDAMVAATRQQYMDFLTCSWMETWFVEFRRAARLVAVAVVDRLDDGLSAVYTFFDPDDTRSGLGTQAILFQIEMARQLELHWCYLGYWVPGSRKMDYKQRFRPLDVRVGKQWIRIKRGQAVKLAREDVV